MFAKRSWESFYSGLIMVGLIFMVFPVIYFCGATKEKQILPPLIMFLLGLVIFVVSVHFSIKYHKEKTSVHSYADRAGERRRRGILGRTGRFLQDSYYDAGMALCETQDDFF